VDQDRRSKQSLSEPSDRNPGSSRRAKRFWLEHGKLTIELRLGVMVMGRSSSCHIVLDDAMVSRRHAQLNVGPEGVTVEDSGSVNGVYVNSRRLRGAEKVREGDHIQIGTQEFVLRSAAQADPGQSGERLNADTLHGVPVAPMFANKPSLPSIGGDSEATFSAHTLDLLGGVADKVLALGRGDEAEKMLAMTLGSLLSEVRSKGPGAAPSEVFEKAAAYAVRLAEATGKGKWVDYAIELFSALGRPLPARVVDHLYEVLRKASTINLSALRAYLDELRSAQESFGPSERFLLQRLEGLERIAALR
jgi:pSer/pThr/pTyr-binding forkhead associated (FHA) protein